MRVYRRSDDDAEAAITPVEAYDPAYWRSCAERAWQRARFAPRCEAAALTREAVDYERLAAYAEAIQVADEAT